jgi:hypothetical protein
VANTNRLGISTLVKMQRRHGYDVFRLDYDAYRLDKADFQRIKMDRQGSPQAGRAKSVWRGPESVARLSGTVSRVRAAAGQLSASDHSDLEDEHFSVRAMKHVYRVRSNLSEASWRSLLVPMRSNGVRSRAQANMLLVHSRLKLVDTKRREREQAAQEHKTSAWLREAERLTKGEARARGRAKLAHARAKIAQAGGGTRSLTNEEARAQNRAKLAQARAKIAQGGGGTRQAPRRRPRSRSAAPGARKPASDAG